MLRADSGHDQAESVKSLHENDHPVAKGYSSNFSDPPGFRPKPSRLPRPRASLPKASQRRATYHAPPSVAQPLPTTSHPAKVTESNSASEKEDAQELHRTGFVRKDRWEELFRPDDIIVTNDNDQPRAYVVTFAPWLDMKALTLHCWSWEFDGQFYKRQTALEIPWPSDEEVIGITELRAYPLVYDKTDLDERLRKRGTKFWGCRERRLVGYQIPLQDTEEQTVCLCLTSFLLIEC